MDSMKKTPSMLRWEQPMVHPLGVESEPHLATPKERVSSERLKGWQRALSWVWQSG